MMKNNSIYSDMLSQLYDLLMEDVDYSGWAEYLEDMCDEWNIRPEKIADISCGTGTMLNELSQLGHVCCGSDISPAMVHVAHSRYPHIPFFVADMNLPALKNTFNLIINVHDALNYLPDISALTLHFDTISKLLIKNQLYIFDLAMEPVILNYFTGVQEWNENETGLRYHRSHEYHLELKRHHTYIDIYENDDKTPVIREEHIQYIFELASIREILTAIPGIRFKLYDEFTFEDADHSSDRLLGVMTHD